jgi:hypothetical protein
VRRSGFLLRTVEKSPSHDDFENGCQVNVDGIPVVDSLILALRLRPNPPQMKPEAFSIMIFCTADPNVVDAKTRSKWSRVLRYARKAKPAEQSLTEFIKSNGGINECARRFARNRRSVSDLR